VGELVLIGRKAHRLISRPLLPDTLSTFTGLEQVHPQAEAGKIGDESRRISLGKHRQS